MRSRWLPGSSPLARGLRTKSRMTLNAVRIIPARAGFTPAQPERVRTVADHPRSRGVYVDVTAYSSKERGSSPLARGLLSVDLVDAGGVGIIPARAGFTDWRASSGPSPADHPRSRGVYASRTGRAHSRPGSSPLARGLPLQGLIRVTLSGIIPARAGFTAVRGGCVWRWRDHPRSRGVYRSDHDTEVDEAGSSPLARGLHHGRVVDVHPRGIIPARAGFTGSCCGTCRTSPDHPRSRGVYLSRTGIRVSSEGSSPLARGLRHRTSSLVNLGRIIPARAGFTRPRTRPWGPTSDHPRSRGVYGPLPSPPLAGTGSSPLARGFTSTGCGPGRPPRDHPRSRGVYTAVQGVRTPVAGSSPLARGLRSSGC